MQEYRLMGEISTSLVQLLEINILCHVGLTKIMRAQWEKGLLFIFVFPRWQALLYFPMAGIIISMT